MEVHEPAVQLPLVLQYPQWFGSSVVSKAICTDDAPLAMLNACRLSTSKTKSPSARVAFRFFRVGVTTNDNEHELFFLSFLNSYAFERHLSAIDHGLLHVSTGDIRLLDLRLLRRRVRRRRCLAFLGQHAHHIFTGGERESGRERSVSARARKSEKRKRTAS